MIHLTRQDTMHGGDQLAWSTSVKQDSPLLQLPPELRNIIYELAAQNESTFSIRPNRELYCPPLSLVCQQTRKEYKRIYLDVAWKYASQINFHVTERLSGLAKCRKNIEASTPDLARKYVVRLFLRRTCNMLILLRVLSRGNCLNDISLASLHQLPAGPEVHEYEIHYDPATFDVPSCQQMLLEMNVEFLRYHLMRWPDWRKIQKAFWEKFERHGLEEQDPSME